MKIDERIKQLENTWDLHEIKEIANSDEIFAGFGLLLDIVGSNDGLSFIKEQMLEVLANEK